MLTRTQLKRFFCAPSRLFPKAAVRTRTRRQRVPASVESLEVRVLLALTTTAPITEFAGPPLTSHPFAISKGFAHDNNIWFTENDFSGNANGLIGRITTAGVITEFQPVTPSVLGGITADNAGNLWFVESDAATSTNGHIRLGEIDLTNPSAPVVKEFSPSLTDPNNQTDLGTITVTPDGNLWFTMSVNNRIGRYTPSTNQFTFIDATSGGTAPNSHPLGITSTLDGRVWITEPGVNINAIYGGNIGQAVSSAVGRIGLITSGATSVTQITVPVSTATGELGNLPIGITLGPDGNLWTTNASATFSLQTGSTTVTTKVGQILASSPQTINQFTTTVTNNLATGITAGADGNLWFVQTGVNPLGSSTVPTQPGEIGEITTTGQSQIFPIPTTNGLPIEITLGPDGNLWFTEHDAVKIGKVTLASSVAATSISISAPAITVGANGSVVVTVSSAGGTPTGNVSLSVDGGTAQVLSLNASGIATFTVTAPAVGTHTLAASYPAQGNFGASSVTGTLIVNAQGVSATSISVQAPPITAGANGTVTVTVSSQGGTPTGNVALSVDGGTPQVQALTNGSAIFTVTQPSAGTHILSASYGAQGNFGASSGSGSLLVNSVNPVSLNLFLIGSDNQVYSEKFDTHLNLISGAALVQLGALGTTLSAVELPTGAPVAFLLGLDNQVYKATFNTAGNLISGFTLTQPGAVRSITATTDSVGGPLLLATGVDNQIYFQRFDVSGNMTAGYALTSPGAVKDVSASGPILFAKGLDNQLYENRLSGTTWVGYSLPAAGPVQGFDYNQQTGLLLAIGGDNQLYAQRIDGTTGASGGWFLTAPGGIKSVSQDLFSGGADVFVIGLDNQVYVQPIASNALPGLSSYFPTQPGTVKSIVSAGVAGTPGLFAVGQDSQVYLLKFDFSTGEVAGGYTSVSSGAVL